MTINNYSFSASSKAIGQTRGSAPTWVWFVPCPVFCTIKIDPHEKEGIRDTQKNPFKLSRDELDIYDSIGMHIQDERSRIEYAREEGERAKALKKEILSFSN